MASHSFDLGNLVGRDAKCLTAFEVRFLPLGLGNLVRFDLDAVVAFLEGYDFGHGTVCPRVDGRGLAGFVNFYYIRCVGLVGTALLVFDELFGIVVYDLYGAEVELALVAYRRCPVAVARCDHHGCNNSRRCQYIVFHFFALVD